VGSTTTLAVFGCIAGFIGTATAIHLARHVYAKGHAFEEAQELAQGKGIINIGAGPHRTLGAQIMAENPSVAANVDIVPDGLPNFIQLDIEKEPLPFPDKQFGCTFASHILEHLDNWQFALDEMVRVADHVMTVLPHPCSVGGWINPGHKQHFSVDDIDEIVNLYPNVTIYY